MSAIAEEVEQIDAEAELLEQRPEYSRELVQAVLFDLWRRLEPQLAFGREFARCERFCAVGGFRRRKAKMKDLEILYISRLTETPDPDDLFGDRTISIDATERLWAELLERKVLAQRLNVKGHVTWGAWNKHAVHVATGLPIDLFRATEENWHNRLVVTTGPRELNVRIAEAALQIGWQWEVYQAGFSPRGVSWDNAEKTRRTMRSESEVFAFVGMDYLKPEERR